MPPFGPLPRGPVLVVDPDVSFLPGDRIVAVGGEPATRTNIDAMGYAAPVRVERQGVPMDLTSPIQQLDPLLYEDGRELAPTCEPSCHGDCGDEDIYGPSGPIDKRKGGR